MLSSLASYLFEAAPELLGVMATWWLRGGLILLFTVWLLRRTSRASAATRHTLLAVALISGLALPVLSSLLPSWSLPLSLPWSVSGLVSTAATWGVATQARREPEAATPRKILISRRPHLR